MTSNMLWFLEIIQAGSHTSTSRSCQQRTLGVGGSGRGYFWGTRLVSWPARFISIGWVWEWGAWIFPRNALKLVLLLFTVGSLHNFFSHSIDPVCAGIGSSDVFVLKFDVTIANVWHKDPVSMRQLPTNHLTCCYRWWSQVRICCRLVNRLCFHTICSCLCWYHCHLSWGPRF